MGEIATTHRYHHIAVIGLWIMSMVLGALMVFGVGYTQQRAEQVSTSTKLADAYSRVKHAVTIEESLERKYRLEPSEKVRTRHRLAGDELEDSLREVSRLGTVSDRTLSDEILREHVAYVNSTKRMFDAVIAGDLRKATEIDGREVDPVAESIHQKVESAAESHRQEALADVEKLLKVVDSIFITLLIGLFVGVVLLLTFSRILTHQQRLATIAREHEHHALHDSLTGLPNRVLLSRRAEAALAERQEMKHVALMVLDLNGFKQINDSLGHHKGDLLLQEIAHRLSAVLGPAVTLGRLSGDEFAVVLTDLADYDEASKVGVRLVGAFNEDFDLSGTAVSVGVSIGISFAPEHGTSVSELLRAADTAMYIAKHNRAGYTIFNKQIAAAFWGSREVPNKRGFGSIT